MFNNFYLTKFIVIVVVFSCGSLTNGMEPSKVANLDKEDNRVEISSEQERHSCLCSRLENIFAFDRYERSRVWMRNGSKLAFWMGTLILVFNNLDCVNHDLNFVRFFEQKKSFYYVPFTLLSWSAILYSLEKAVGVLADIIG